MLNTHGAKIECKRPLDVNQEVLVTLLLSEERGEMSRVVWCDSNQSDSGNFEVGMEIHEAERLWGVPFPTSL